MVMAVNNAPLLAKSFDFSTLDDSYYKGQKLRQAYDTRQQNQALNELMAVDDFNERKKLAQAHKYAGALVPLIEQYEEARQKASLDNLKSSADIQKTFGETGKLNAETGKIGAETTGQEVKNAQGISDFISLAAVTRDPRSFQLKIGELAKRGLLTPAQTATLVTMVQQNPQQATKVLERMAMGNIEVAKTFKPKLDTVDAGDKVYGFNVNPFSGEIDNEIPELSIEKGQSPDNMADNQAKMYGADRSYQGSVYGADQRLAGQQYTADQALKREQFKSEWDYRQAIAESKKGKYQSIGGKAYIVFPDGTADPMIDKETGQQLLDNKAGVGGKPKPAKILEMENKYISILNETQNTGDQLQQWINNLDVSSGNKQDKLELGLIDNTLNSAGNWLGVSSESGKKYAEFNSFIKDLATKALRLNAGVQTDSDYKRQLEAMVSGEYIPRDNATAIALLNKMKRDFEVAQSSAYSGLANIRSEWGGAIPSQAMLQPDQQPQQQGDVMLPGQQPQPAKQSQESSPLPPQINKIAQSIFGF